MANIYFYTGPSGQTLYVRIKNPAGAWKATALTEGGAGEEGLYYATEATIAALAGMNVASTGDGCLYTVRVGAPATSGDDPISSVSYLPWSGSAAISQAIASDVAGILASQSTATDSLDTLVNSIGLIETTIVQVGSSGIYRFTAAALALAPAAPTAGAVADAVAAEASISAGLQTIALNLDAKVSEAGGSGGGTVAQVSNAKIVAARVFKLGTRRDGVAYAAGTLLMYVGETYPAWIDTTKYAGGEPLYNADDEDSSGDGLAIDTTEVNRELVVLPLTATVAGSYVASAVAHPEPGQDLIVALNVIVKERP